MSGPVALTGLTALLALAGCFQLNVDSCRLLCSTSEGCPGDLQCRVVSGSTQALCVSAGTTMCPPIGGIDGSAGGMDGSADRTDAGSADAEAGTSLPPSMLCHNGNCLTLPADVRANLVLLLWPSNLPAVVGSTVDIWNDQSGQGNNATALDPSALPHVIADGVQLDSTQLGTGFVVVNSPSLDFGSGDFAVIVVAGLSSSTTPLSFFKKSDGARTNSQQISIDWVLSSTSSALTGQLQGVVDDTTVPASADVSQPSVEAYTLSRSTDQIELDLNETVVGTADLPTPGLSTTDSKDLYLGVNGTVGSPVDSIEAVVVIRGSIGSTELGQLEGFMRDVFATSSP